MCRCRSFQWSRTLLSLMTSGPHQVSPDHPRPSVVFVRFPSSCHPPDWVDGGSVDYVGFPTDVPPESRWGW